MTPAAVLAALALVRGPLGDAPPAPTAAAFAALGGDAAHDLVILGETRPIFLRLRVMVGARSSRAAWDESVRALHALLDRNKDGKLTVKEVDANRFAANIAPPGAAAKSRGAVEWDVRPKDGVISLDELAEALGAEARPFQIQLAGNAERRTDALFDHLDRDKDGLLTRPELSAIAGSLRRLDLDDDERIGADEVAPPAAPAVVMNVNGRPARVQAVPTVVEIDADASPLRLARHLFRKYDKGSPQRPGRPDAKLSNEEFAIPTNEFAAADADRDGTLNDKELRQYLAKGPRDAILDVALTPEAGGRAVARVRGGDGGTPAGIKVRQLADGVVEVDVGAVRLDIHVDDGAGAAAAARKALRDLFEAADANQDGYVEESELTQDNGQTGPLSGIFRVIESGGDGKLYPRELDDYVAQQAVAASGRLILKASDEGRALFGLLDMDRDRQLGAREVLDTFARVSACDRDGDGRVTPDEIPHHIQLTLARGDLSGLLQPLPGLPATAFLEGSMVPRPERSAGPAWFRRMDRNRDGDVSRREFLGSREQFDRLDRDRDGLIAPGEADAATPAARPVKGPGG